MITAEKTVVLELVVPGPDLVALKGTGRILTDLPSELHPLTHTGGTVIGPRNGLDAIRLQLEVSSNNRDIN
ncbi:sugar transporter [Sesbania bispinosa]|nr:sugar transporter [Sesbania bispinosa]